MLPSGKVALRSRCAAAASPGLDGIELITTLPLDAQAREGSLMHALPPTSAKGAKQTRAACEPAACSSTTISPPAKEPVRGCNEYVTALPWTVETTLSSEVARPHAAPDVSNVPEHSALGRGSVLGEPIVTSSSRSRDASHGPVPQARVKDDKAIAWATSPGA